MYTYKERKHHLAELRNPSAVGADLELLRTKAGNVKKGYEKNPSRYAEEILYELLGVATREEIREHRRKVLYPHPLKTEEVDTEKEEIKKELEQTKEELEETDTEKEEIKEELEQTKEALEEAEARADEAETALEEEKKKADNVKKKQAAKSKSTKNIHE